MAKRLRAEQYAAKKARARELWAKGLSMPVIRARLGIGATALGDWVREWKNSLTCGVKA